MNRIKQLRTSNNLTLKQLSQKLDNKISPDALAKYERGEREPKIDKWQILAKYFGVSVPYLQGTTTYEVLGLSEKGLYSYVIEAMNRAFDDYIIVPEAKERVLKAIAYSIDDGEFI